MSELPLFLYCYPSGQLASGGRVPSTALVIARGESRDISRGVAEFCPVHPDGGYAAFVSCGDWPDWTAHGRAQVMRLAELLQTVHGLEVLA